MNSKHIFLSTLVGPLVIPSLNAAETNSPNILFVISDDQSYPHASAYGSPIAKTPAFDFVARNGWLFNNAFVTSPGSSPSRASILTGLYPWQIAEAGTHASSFPAEYKCFPDILAEAGYHVGCTGKGWGPGDWKISGRKHNPAGPEYNKRHIQPPFKGVSNTDYYQNLVNTAPITGKEPQFLLTLPDMTNSFERVIIKEKPILRVYYASYKD